MWYRIKKFFSIKSTLHIYMKSGNVIKMKCKEFKCSKLSGNANRSLAIDGADCYTWSIDVDEIEAIICNK